MGRLFGRIGQKPFVQMIMESTTSTKSNEGNPKRSLIDERPIVAMVLLALPPEEETEKKIGARADGENVACAESVCLVDDDPSARRSVTRLLESDGFNVESFSGPGSFFRYLATHETPLVVLDIWMEEMNGMEVLVHLCAKSPQTRIIFITGREDPAAKATVMQAGALGFFVKPLDAEKFLGAVHRALEHPARDPVRPSSEAGRRSHVGLWDDGVISQRGRSSSITEKEKAFGLCA